MDHYDLDSITQELMGSDIADMEGDTAGTNFTGSDGEYHWVSADTIATAIKQAYELGKWEGE